MNKYNIFTYLFCFLISLNLSAQKSSAKDESKKPKKEKTYKDIITKKNVNLLGMRKFQPCVHLVQNYFHIMEC